MTSLTFSDYSARLGEFIACSPAAAGLAEELFTGKTQRAFNELALALFGLQFAHNLPYRRVCQARGVSPAAVTHWGEIPAIPTSAFKELDLTSLAPAERTFVFHSSGTTEQRPSRHFHDAESLKVYEASLLAWFRAHLAGDLPLIFLTPPPKLASHSSLVYMFDALRRRLSASGSTYSGAGGIDYPLPKGALTPALSHPLRRRGSAASRMGEGEPSSDLYCIPRFYRYTGSVDAAGGWLVHVKQTRRALLEAVDAKRPFAVLGTAFNFVHLLDHLIESGTRLHLPEGSWVLETGGYKGRSRDLPKAELHSLITEYLGIPSERIVCEYGMSELSSQAYDRKVQSSGSVSENSNLIVGADVRRLKYRDFPEDQSLLTSAPTISQIGPEGQVQSPKSKVQKPAGRGRVFHFPPWARVQVISPETEREVGEGETGLIRVFDLANVRSVLAIQTEDLGVRRGTGFELLGRAKQAEPRGCSLMVA